MVDTRIFETHAQWCGWLFGRGSLAEQHKRCQSASRCVAGHHHSHMTTVAECRERNALRAMQEQIAVVDEEIIAAIFDD
jgi:hypothetical protein